MFGESESESPRVGSPWDSFMPSISPSNTAELEVKTRLNEGLPKLVPEVEYGNVEYKLKLINPSPERFLRLVTQMKWRLLEGGGQAYYELGVADSGHLIGLSRKDLEQSLETLEMMAGEIGASVIIVKEIEVPAALVGRAMSAALGLPQRTPVPLLTSAEPKVNTAAETETSATEDDEDFLLTGLELGLELSSEDDRPIACRQITPRSHPERPTFQSSPAILPTSDLEVDPFFHSEFEIEISSVYKPRPHRAHPVVTQTKYTKRGTAPKAKKSFHPRVETDPAQRATEKRIKRDARRDARRKALLVPASDAIEDVNKTFLDLQELHSSLETTPSNSQHVMSPYSNLDGLDIKDEADESVVADTMEPRLIVEALVVRKLALEEAFLDFGGFSLEM